MSNVETFVQSAQPGAVFSLRKGLWDAGHTFSSTMSTDGAISSTFILTETAALYMMIAARHLSTTSRPALTAATFQQLMKSSGWPLLARPPMIDVQAVACKAFSRRHPSTTTCRHSWRQLTSQHTDLRRVYQSRCMPAAWRCSH